MFKRKNRVPGNVGFNNALILSTLLFTIKIKKNGLSINRFAVIVSKKIDLRATIRNKVKRLVRIIIEELYKTIDEGYDTLFIAKKGILKKTKNEIHMSIKEVLGKKTF